MIKLIKTPDWGQISNFEMEMVGELDGCCSVIIEPESCVEFDKVFWSVYQRYDPKLAPDGFRGAECLADCDTPEEAKSLYDNFSEVLSVYGFINSTTKKLNQCY